MLRFRTALALFAVTAAVLAAAGGAAFLTDARERGARLKAEEKLVASFQRNDELELELTAALREKEEVQTRLHDAENRLYELNGRLGLLHEELKRNRAVAQRARVDYGRALKHKRRLLGQLRKRDRQIKEILTALLEAKRSGAAPSVDLGSVIMPAVPRAPLVVQRQFDVEETPSEVQGEIIAVNEEFDFVVVNLGRSNGIEKGARFFVYRGGRALGEARVEMVHENLSAATLTVPGLKVEAGDKVFFQPA